MKRERIKENKGDIKGKNDEVADGGGKERRKRRKRLE